MEGHQGDEYDEALSTLAELEDIGWKVQLCLMDTQRAEPSSCARRLPAEPAGAGAGIINYPNLCCRTTNRCSRKVNFLMQAAMGLSISRQNRIIKIFLSGLGGIPAAPALVASSYRMNFEFMPELHWSLVIGRCQAGPAGIADT